MLLTDLDIINTQYLKYMITYLLYVLLCLVAGVTEKFNNIDLTPET